LMDCLSTLENHKCRQLISDNVQCSMLNAIVNLH
jgi:hypothetical protein